MAADENPMPGTARAIERAREIVLRHGWNATAYQIVNPGMRLWFSRTEDAVAGYVDAGWARVVAGAPVCAGSVLKQVIHEFEDIARRDQRSVCYFGAESRLASVCQGHPTYSTVVLGAQPAWQPAHWEEMLAAHPSLRMQLNRARNKDVRIEEWQDCSDAQKSMLNRCLSAWLATRGLPPMHFLVEPETLEFLEDRRLLVAKWREEVTGFLVASPVPVRCGWLVEQIIRCPSTPNGTAELLLDALHRAVRDTSSYITLGLSPLSARGGVAMARNPLWLRLVLSWAKAHGSRFYNFDGLDAFKAKFRPQVWEPVYAIANQPQFRPSMLYAIASAFADRQPLRMVAKGLSRAVAREGRCLVAGVMRRNER